MFCSRRMRAQPFIYLLTHDPDIRFLFFHGSQVPLPNLGFSLAGFTAFHASGFPNASSLWHFYSLYALAKDLRHTNSRQNHFCPGLLFHPAQTLRANRSSCEHGLSSDLVKTSDCVTYTMQIFYRRNTSFSKRVKRFKISMLPAPLFSVLIAPCLPSSSTIFARNALICRSYSCK